MYCKKYLNASASLESSVVFPIIILSSIFLVLYAFFIHDKINIKSMTYRFLIENYNKDDIPDTADMTSKIKEILLLNQDFQMSYENNNETLSIKSDSPLSMDITFSNYKRCEYIRMYSTLFELVQ